MITMYHYLALGLVLFLIGLVGTITVKNVIKILVSIEFMLAGININFVAFSSYCDNIDFSGYITALFYTGLGAVELAVGLYIFYLMFKKKGSDSIEKYNELR